MIKMKFWEGIILGTPNSVWQQTMDDNEKVVVWEKRKGVDQKKKLEWVPPLF